MLRNVHQPVYTGQVQSVKGIDTPIFQCNVFAQDMQDALRSEREGREEDRFLRGVEVESVELSKDQIGLIESDKVQSVLLAVSNDKRYDPFTRAVAAALRPFLDKTKIRIEDKLYSPDGEEVLGSL